MNIIAVDDEELALEGCISAIKKAQPSARVEGFTSGEKALEKADQIKPQVAFLDVEMRTENGINIAKKLQEKNPRINIIFVTGYSDYMKEAFGLYASGYIMKPVTAAKVKSEFEHLRFPEESVAPVQSHKLRVHTFGEFEVFTENGVPLDFVYTKTRELLAVLIDANGAMRTFNQIMEKIWQDEDDAGSHRSYMRNLFADMARIFAELGCSEALIRRRGEAGINKEYFDCDYFDFLDGKRDDTGFTGEYMNQYSWAEPTLGKLFQLSDGMW
ncbi:LytR/AlgR family response regulator transcription factor [Butyrivibrio sp. XPD2002]|uniref:LytR/AlgR family response regulator transcription factor n=1 Tax=Butyrivibrio sp. XPD2002 TaxID=1280665 RepID=UPI0003F76CE0|nr:response regulator [Butyrivibrio sp. XPD2002]